MAEYFTTFEEVTGYIGSAIGDEFVEDFDLVAIGRELVDYVPGRGFCMDCFEDDFWAAVASHDVTAKAGC